jgi:iron uptake system component EfeO
MVAPVARAKVYICALAATAALIVGCGAGSDVTSVTRPAEQPPSGRSATPIEVSTGSCGAGWTRPTPGPQQFVLHNTDYRAAEVLLTTKGGGVVGYVESIGAGATANLRVQLASGRYAFRCAMEDADVVTGPTVVVPGHVSGGSPAVRPVSQAQLLQPTLRYERYVRARLPRLLALVRRLNDDVQAADLPAAKSDWLSAHLAYERLGAAYGAFGQANSQINGLPDGLARGVHAKGFTGFHRIEYGLWHRQPAATITPSTSRLVASVKGLVKTFANAQIDPLQISIRAHEIVENTLQFELTGQTDFGSGSALATASANLDGTATVLGLLMPLLRPRYTRLPQLHRAMQVARSDLDRLKGPAGWPRLQSLTTRQRELVNADFSQLSELLAPVASICEPRRS